MAVYQDKAKERIRGKLAKAKRIARKAIDEKYSEADTRKLVIDMLTTALGWDRFEDVTAEQMKGAGIADYVVKRKGQDLMVIEVKKAGMRLTQAHVDQAKSYAVEQGMEWAVVTNGDTWEVYRIEFTGKPPKMPEARFVFEVSLLDEDTKNPEKAELFYYLSEEAFRKDEIVDYFDRRIALSGENLAATVLENEVLDRIRIAIYNNTRQRITNAEVAEAIVGRVFDRELVCEDHFKLIRKIQRAKKGEEKS